MTGFAVYNDRYEPVVSTTDKMVAVISEQPVEEIKLWYDNGTLAAPAFIDKNLGVPGLPLLSVNPPLTLLKPNDGGCGCGNVYYSAYAGTLKHLSKDYITESGYLDVFDEAGNLIWSAKSAEKVPRVIQVINVPAANLIAGTTINIGNDHLMMNNLPSIMYPGPMGASRVGGLYWRYSSNGALNLKYGIRGNAVISDYVNAVYGETGMNFYIYRFTA